MARAGYCRHGLEGKCHLCFIEEKNAKINAEIQENFEKSKFRERFLALLNDPDIRLLLKEILNEEKDNE